MFQKEAEALVMLDGILPGEGWPETFEFFPNLTAPSCKAPKGIIKTRGYRKWEIKVHFIISLVDTK